MGLIRKYVQDDTKLWMGIMILLSAHHFLIYSREVADELERECRTLEKQESRSNSCSPTQKLLVFLAARNDCTIGMKSAVASWSG